MASRESQGLQVALILFVMVTVVLAVTTYVYFRKSEEKIKERDQYRAEASRAKETMQRMDFQNQALKHILGFDRKTDTELATIKQSLGADAQMTEVFTAYDEDMKMYGQGLPPEDLSYRNLPRNLITAIRDRNSQITEANKLVSDLTQERDQVRAAEERRTTAAVSDLTVAQNDLAGERSKFNDERTRVTDEKDRIAVQLKTKDNMIQQISSKAQTDVEVLTKQLTQVTQLYEGMKASREREKETTFETPDGKISWVNQRSNTVWIDLGSADGLQPQMTFSVYDQKETGVTKGKVKGRIEVTRIMEGHLAEARIIEDVLSDPILPNDKIYSPSFRKGSKTRFALTGFLDIDGDGKSDNAKVKSIITLNGGVVDAELLEDGTVAGRMTVDTRYLVQGQKPTDTLHAKLTKGYTEMIGDAGKYGIEIITLDRMLERLGYVQQEQVVPLNRGGTGGAGTTGRPGDPNSNQFRPRTQPKSAY